MKKFGLLMISAALTAAMLSASCTPEGTSKNTGGTESGLTGPSSAPPVLFKEDPIKDAFLRDMEAKLDSYEDRIRSLQSDARKSTGESKKDLEESIREAVDLQRYAREGLDEIKTSGARDWEEPKMVLERAADDIEFALNKAAASAR